jgi:hypothetical protein
MDGFVTSSAPKMDGFVTSSAPKMDGFVTRKRDSKECGHNINQKAVRAEPSQVRLHLLQLFKLIFVSKIHHVSVLR